ncbi:ankyrin repeat domain-containing protein [Planctomycetota bacterium]
MRCVGLWVVLVASVAVGCGDDRSLGDAVVFESVADVKQRLIDGEPVDAKDARGRTPLERAIIWRKPDMATLLLKHGADPNHRTVRGAEGGTDCLGLLLQGSLLGRGVSPELLALIAAKITDLNRPQGPHGRTPLYEVLLHSRVDLAGALLEHGADINARNAEGSGGHGQTPLFACLGLQGTAEGGPMGSTRALEWALEHGSDPGLAQEGGKTPLDLAYRDTDRELLLRYAAEREGAGGKPSRNSER